MSCPHCCPKSIWERFRPKVRRKPIRRPQWMLLHQLAVDIGAEWKRGMHERAVDAETLAKNGGLL